MTIRILVGDCREALKRIPDDSVHCVVTSPPYWGLRDYGNARWVGGDEMCSHRPSETPTTRGLASSTLQGGKSSTGHQQEGYKGLCPRCGAKQEDGGIGLEPTLAEHLVAIRAVFREVRRVLRPDGTLWLNYGDAYASSVNGRSAADTKAAGTDDRTFRDKPIDTTKGSGLKPKDLMGLPWRVAFALQDDGWYLRSDIIWHKPNPMPESVTDRPTKAHEYLFLMSKSQKYFFDADAIAEPTTNDSVRGPALHGDLVSTNGNSGLCRRPISETRNVRSVWSIPTAAFSEAHFATFPPQLVERCVKAGCPPGGIVLDPFGGAGTTGLVADRLQRDSIMVEFNSEYVEMSRRRIERDGGMLCEVVVE